MKSDYCDEAYDRVIASSVSDDEMFSQIKLLGYNKDEEKKEISIEYKDYKIVSVFTEETGGIILNVNFLVFNLFFIK